MKMLGWVLGDGAYRALSFVVLFGGCSATPSPTPAETDPSDESDESDRSEPSDSAETSEDGSTRDASTNGKPKLDAQTPPGTGGQGTRPGNDGGTPTDSARSDGGGEDAGTSGPTEPGTVDPGSTVLPVCSDKPPENFEANAKVGGGGSQFKDSAHFRIYGAGDTQTDAALKFLEAAYSCFVETLCWRSSGLSINGPDTGPYYKMNFYTVAGLGSAAGQMFSDAATGLAYEKVVASYLTDAKVSVHEYGHALNYSSKTWVDQTATGAWWETVANFVADTFMTSPLCEPARKEAGQPEGKTIIELNKVIGDSFQVIVDGSQGSGNYYQAWPFLTYLTNNPDGWAGLGPSTLGTMLLSHKRNNETPLHVLERVAAPTKVQKIVGRYWARMAYVDIGHKQAQAAFTAARSRLNYANLDGSGSSYKVKAARAPRYMGANIIPLKGSGKITAKVTSSAPFTATLAVRASSGMVRYVDLEGGAGEATLESGEEATLVVANTPATLLQYDGFKLSGAPANQGLDYQVELTGATPAN
ncbi:MAG: hypothetical protein RLZZ450_1152 [Pseudomonadota bacterium]